MKNSKELEKKLKIFKKDLDDKFKGKIKELNNLTQNQAQYNALISTLISEMGLDDNFNEEDKKDDDNKDKKPDDTKNEEQQADKKEEINQEMSIESGVPDLDNQTKESDQDVEEIEVEDKSKSELKKKLKKI